MGGPEHYGSRYWCIKVHKDVSKSGEIYCHADHPVFHEGGQLAMIGGARATLGDVPDKGPIVVLALPAAKWFAVYAASCFDGSAVAVDHWDGEVSR